MSETPKVIVVDDPCFLQPYQRAMFTGIDLAGGSDRASVIRVTRIEGPGFRGDLRIDEIQFNEDGKAAP